MLVEHAITVDSAVIVAGAPASISTSRAMLLHVRFGTTLPQIAKSGTTPPARCSIARATGTDRPIASSLDNAPSTLANGVRTPAASQMSGGVAGRSEEHTSEPQSLMRISHAVFCLKKKK